MLLLAFRPVGLFSLSKCLLEDREHIGVFLVAILHLLLADQGLTSQYDIYMRHLQEKTSFFLLEWDHKEEYLSIQWIYFSRYISDSYHLNFDGSNST